MIVVAEPDTELRQRLCAPIDEERITQTTSAEEAINTLCKYKSKVDIIIGNIHLIGRIVAKDTIYRVCQKFSIETPPLLAYYKKEHADLLGRLRDHKIVHFVELDQKENDFPSRYLESIKEVYPSLRVPTENTQLLRIEEKPNPEPIDLDDLLAADELPDAINDDNHKRQDKSAEKQVAAEASSQKQERINKTIDKFKNQIDILAKRVRQFSPKEETTIREEIRNLYIEIANSINALTQVQQQVKALANNFHQHKTKQKEFGKCYPIVKSQIASELDLVTLIDRAWNLIVMEDYDEALRVLKKALDIDEQNIKGLGFMGLAFMHKELYDSAMIYLQRVLLLEPDNQFALNNLGYVCYKKGIYGEAIEHLSKVAKQNVDRTAALYANYYLGLVYYERSMISDAIAFFTEALRLGPNLQEAYYYLGMSELKEHKFQIAAKHLTKCCEINDQSKYGKLSKIELDKIKPITKAGRISSSGKPKK